MVEDRYALLSSDVKKARIKTAFDLILFAGSNVQIAFHDRYEAFWDHVMGGHCG